MVIGLKPNEILELILQMRPGDKYTFFEDIQIEFRGYEGLVASKGWDSDWKKKKHRYKSKLGLFDFRALVGREPPTHRKLLLDTVENISVEELCEIYSEGDPYSFKGIKKRILQQIQLLFLEQEINYGEEIFQAWTKMRAPRDFFMAYLVRVLDMRKDDAIKFIDEKTDNRGIIRRPPEGADWKTYRSKLEGKRWLKGTILEKYREKAKKSQNNLNWQDRY